MMKYLLLFLFFLTNLVADNLHIDLTENCDLPPCKPRSWYLIDSFDPSYLQLTEPDKTWHEVTQFPIWMNKHFPKEGSLSTYTLVTYFDIPDEILNHPEQAGIRFGEIGEAFEIYLNGNRIAKEGEVSVDKVSFHRTVRGKVWQVPKGFMQAKNNYLLVKLSGHPKFDHTGFYLTKHYDFGLADALKYDEQDRISLMLVGIYAVVGLYHLFLFFRRREEKYNFYYGAFAFIVSLYIYTRSSVIFENNWDTAIIQKFEFAILYPGVTFLIESLSALFNNKPNRWSKYYAYFSYTICVLTLLSPEMYMAEHILRLWQISVLTCVLPLILYTFYQAISKKASNAKILLTGFIFFMAASIYDILESLFFNTGIAFVKYTFMMYILGFAGVLANHFLSIHNEIEELNENLEKKVEDRTKALSTSLGEIQKLKDQQDGDYFLTSLLLQPLGANQAKAAEVKVEFLIKQKKRFRFKQWESEIGGDLCRSQTIHFKGKPMTVFLNADAMGKSMQGAGGALVAGAVFNSIIERTMLSPTVQNQYPERWLKNSFVEMHKVFESFDGSMLISVVMGILDNSSGLLYFINAEHPYTVLFRDGKTSFIGNDKVYRKLGSGMADNFVSIQTFQMHDGDVIINGSDGRDDLMITDNTEHTKALNYDEKIFLSIVKNAKGEINEIYKQLQLTGEFTDDLSLLRIEFTSPHLAFEAYEDQEMPDIEIAFDKINDETRDALDEQLHEYYNDTTQNLRALKFIIVGFIRLKQFHKAIALAHEYLDLIPSDTTMIYYLAYAYRKDRSYNEAIEQGERVRLRNPLHFKNLINLVRSYASFGNLIRAKEILNSAASLEPDNLKVLRLRMQIEKVMEKKRKG
ncbi:MAG TPA: 7TM diverse intracellular signaling domain-containing protein [Leptospiraceae bacterium]|nr:7TM diverse intracellular signaling domain-containing protein [Leptospiraceae bacterium]